MSGTPCALNWRRAFLLLMLAPAAVFSHTAPPTRKPPSPDGDIAKRATQALLKMPVFELILRDRTLVDALEQFRILSGVNLDVDWKAVEAVGVTADSLVSMRLSKVPAADVLRRILRQAGEDKLGYVIEGNTVHVSTREMLDAVTSLKVYDVSDLAGAADTDEDWLAARMDEIVELVKVSVLPTYWTDNKASIRPFDDRLVVVAPDVVHEAIDDLLLKLREGRTSKHGRQKEASDALVVQPWAR